MSAIEQAAAWLTDPSNWSGPGSIAIRLLEHIEISGLGVLIAAGVAVPAGLYIGHTGRGERLIVPVANLGRAIPSFAILALALPVAIRLGLGLGFWPTIIALFALGVPPILTNTYVGIQAVDKDTREAAEAMGMTGRQVLSRLELPLAAPVIAGGVRTAAVQVLATATLAALVAWGGLGRFLIDGFATQDEGMILGGAVLVALLAVATELMFGLLEKAMRPRTGTHNG